MTRPPDTRDACKAGPLTTSALLLAAILGPLDAAAQDLSGLGERLPLNGTYEPSGIIQLPDGRMIVVEDEKEAAIHLLTPRDGGAFTGTPLRIETSSGLLDDLEAIAMGKDGYVYAITSHARTAAGKRLDTREKLVRFKVEGDRAVASELLTSLRDRMASLHEEISEAATLRDTDDDDHLNVEGLAYDHAGDRLLIGLRGPVIDGNAVVLVIPDPETAFAGGRSAIFSDQLIFLDLDKGGIRAMAHDAELGGFLIVSRREKKGRKFKLWFWDGDSDQRPRRLRPGKKIDLAKAEGVTPIHINGTDQIMLVFDTGQRSKGKNGQYMLLSRDQLRE